MSSRTVTHRTFAPRQGRPIQSQNSSRQQSSPSPSSGSGLPKYQLAVPNQRRCVAVIDTWTRAISRLLVAVPVADARPGAEHVWAEVRCRCRESEVAVAVGAAGVDPEQVLV